MNIDYFTEDHNAYKPLQSKAHWNEIATDAKVLPVDATLRELCAAFREGDKIARTAMRAQYAGNRNLLIFLHRMANQMLREPGREDYLTDGITALLLENGRLNYRDSLSYGGMLRYAADLSEVDFPSCALALVENGKDSSAADELVRYFASLESGKVSLAKFSLRVKTIDEKTQLILS